MNISEDTIKKYSPVNLIPLRSKSIPPIFIARAGLDSKVINQSIEEFIKEALNYNLPLDILNHPTGHHGFDLFDDNHRTYEIIDRTLDFLKSNLLDH